MPIRVHYGTGHPVQWHPLLSPREVPPVTAPAPPPVRRRPAAAPQVRRDPPVPPLHPGDRLTRDEFLRRYDAMPHVKKAELIDGRVYMPSPVRNLLHGNPHSLMSCWLVGYHAVTPGTESCDNGTILLDETNTPQPDLSLRLLTEAGGQSRQTDDDYIEGAPELVAEIAASSAAYDLHEKLETYRSHGVREYVVWRTEDGAIDWFVLRDGRFVPLDPDTDGVLRSGVFPGLWLDREALLRRDMAAALAVLKDGTDSAEHAGFVAGLP